MSDDPRPEHPRRHQSLLIVLSVAVHVLLLVLLHWRTGQIDGFAFQSVDATEYYTLARNLYEQAVFSTSPEAPLDPDFWRTPGYPLTLAGLMTLVGTSPTSLVIAQQVFAALNVILLFVIARHQMSSRRALLVSVIYLLMPYRLFYATWLLSTTVFSTGLLATWWSFQRWHHTPTPARAVMLGAMTGVTILVRPIAVLLPLALFGYMALRAIRTDTGTATRSRRTAVVMMLVCTAVVGVWVIRNRMQGGHWNLSSQGGVVLAYFKATEVRLWHEGRSADRYRETSLHPDRLDEAHLVWDDIDTRLQSRFADAPLERRQTLTWRRLAQGNRSDLDPFEVSDALSAIAWEMLWEHPLSTAALCAGRSVMVLVFPLHLGWDDGAPFTARLRSIALGSAYVALLALALVNALRRTCSWRVCYFPLIGIACLLLATTPQLDPRFRVPMLPFLLVLALLPGLKRQAPTSTSGADAPTLVSEA